MVVTDGQTNKQTNKQTQAKTLSPARKAGNKNILKHKNLMLQVQVRVPVGNLNLSNMTQFEPGCVNS